jgi:hypothetical protein
LNFGFFGLQQNRFFIMATTGEACASIALRASSATFGFGSGFGFAGSHVRPRMRHLPAQAVIYPQYSPFVSFASITNVGNNSVTFDMKEYSNKKGVALKGFPDTAKVHVKRNKR